MHFIHHPSNVENYLIGHKSETDHQSKKKKDLWRIYFYTFILVLDLKIKIQNGQKSLSNFLDTCKIDT